MSFLVQDKFTSDKNIFNITLIRNSFRTSDYLRQDSAISAEKKENFKNTWDESNDPMWLLSNEGIIIGVNKAFCDLFEQKEIDLVGKYYSNCYEKVEEEEIKSSLQDDSCYFEQHLITAKGKNVFLEGINTVISSSYVHVETFQIEPLVFTIFRDVTKKKNCSTFYDTLNEIINPLSDAVMMIDNNSIIESWNNGAELIFGYKKDEIIGKPLSFLELKNGMLEGKRLLSRLRKEDKILNLEVRKQMKNQEYLELLANIVSMKNNKGEVAGATIIIKNITDMKTAEIVLKESEERYRTLIETSPDAIIILDVSGRIVMSNKQFCFLIECQDIEDVIGKALDSYIIRRDKRRLSKDLEEVLNAGIKKEIYFKVKTRNRTVPVEMNASLVVDMLGKPDAIICTMRDITERMKVENELKKSELLFRSVWENSNDGMRLTDGNGRIVEANKSYCTFAGMKKEELIGKYFYEVYSDEEIVNPDDLLKKYKKNFYENNFSVYTASKFKYRNGQSVELNESYKIIETEKNSQLLLGIFHNVTEMRKAEEELRNSEKFAAIGKQTAILSHDIKTPLASIKMNIDMLYNSLSLPESNQRSFKIIQKEIKRLVKLLKNVLQYSKEVDPILGPVELTILFDNIQEFMKPLLDEANAVLLNKVNSIKVLGDYKNLQTVFMHLIENSLDSMENGGAIEIYSDDNDLYSSIFIKDNGCGIIDSQKIFDPFFTTKNTGTGLGLSIANNILSKHNADIQLVSSKAGETIFEIRFFKKKRE